MKKLFVVAISAQTDTEFVFGVNLCLADAEEVAFYTGWEKIREKFPKPEYCAHKVALEEIPEEVILAAGYIKAEDKDETIKKLEATLAAERLYNDDYRKQAERRYSVWQTEKEALESKVNWYKQMWKETSDIMVRLAEKHKKLSEIVRQAMTPEQYHSARKIVENEP